MSGHRRVRGRASGAGRAGAAHPAADDRRRPAARRTVTHERACSTAAPAARRGASPFGALALLTGCNLRRPQIPTRSTACCAAMSRWNDRVQAALFDPHRLAPTYPASAITDPFPFNAYYAVDEVREVDGDAWRLELSGACRRQAPLDAGGPARAAAGEPDHAAYLRRGLERDRPMERRAVPRFPATRSAPTRAPAMSASTAPTTITPASTWRRRCIRRPFWRSTSATRRCRRNTGFR